MTAVLTQEEIDQLLTLFYIEGYGIKEFEDFLSNRWHPEKPYGIFNEGITMCRFWNSNLEYVKYI